MAERPLFESPPISLPDAGTPPNDWDETLLRAIDAGKLDASQAADAKLAGAFAAHQKLESLFAALRGDEGESANAFCTQRPPWRSADDPPPERLGRYVVRGALGAGAFGTVYIAHDPELNRDVAIKVSRERAADHDPLSLRERASLDSHSPLSAKGSRAGTANFWAFFDRLL